MPRSDGYRRYFEAAAVLGEITRARAEELVRELMSSGDVQRAQAQQWVDELVERSRRAAEDLIDLVRTEVSNQMQALGLDPDELARQAAEILRRSAEAGLRVVQDVTPARARKSSAKKAAEHAEGGKKGAAKSAAETRAGERGGSKKATAKKATPGKRPAKKSAAKKSAAKSTGAKKSPAKKSAAKKSAADKSAATTHAPAPASTP